VTAVAVVAVAVTARVPPSTVAYADVQLAGHVATVVHLAGGTTDAAAVAAAVAAAPPAPTGQSSSTTSTMAPGPVPRAVMIVGDSGMFDVSIALGALYARLGTATVVNASWPGFGFTRDPPGWHHDWPALIAATHPQVVFVMLGGWDWAWVQAHGVDAYENVLADAGRVLSAGGARIMWLGEPPGGNARPDQIDPLFERFVAAHTGATAFADPAPVLRTLDGQTPRWLPAADGHLELIRKPDDWHFCADGAVRVARLAATAAARMGWSAAPVTGWEHGSWRTDHRFDDPRGGCDPSRPANAPPR
jgi:hypothetical protein